LLILAINDDLKHIILIILNKNRQMIKISINLNHKTGQILTNR
jgi:hypothetical protein